MSGSQAILLLGAFWCYHNSANRSHMVIYNVRRGQHLTAQTIQPLHPISILQVNPSLRFKPVTSIRPLTPLYVRLLPGSQSPCQPRARCCGGGAGIGSQAGTSHLPNMVPGAGNSSSVGGSQIQLLWQHKAGVGGWFSAGHWLFLNLQPVCNFAGQWATSWKARTSPESFSVHQRGDTFDFVNFFFYVLWWLQVLCSW